MERCGGGGARGTKSIDLSEDLKVSIQVIGKFLSNKTLEVYRSGYLSISIK
jgi:hypothetical protein